MTTTDYQKECFKNYKNTIGYPANYTYLTGNPINVLVPIETTLNNVMIVGAYPSAKFYTINGVSDTPMTDNDSPFSNESYFDGSRVRTIPSGKELNEVILEKIDVKRSDCWITDLVKVFLFKEGHIKRYKKLGKTDLAENRTKFIQFAEKSLKWLETEIDICNPKIIVLLGAEVSQVFFAVSYDKAKNWMTGNVIKKVIRGVERNIICLPHPGILIKRTEKNKWIERFDNKISIIAKEEISRFIK